MKTQRETVLAYVREKYGTSPEYLWKNYPQYAVLRHPENRKWYAILMNVQRRSLQDTGTQKTPEHSRQRQGMYALSDGEEEVSGDGYVDVINVKISDIAMHDILLGQEGIFPAYHMQKKSWLSVVLDGSVSEEEVQSLIDTSFADTAPAGKRKKLRGPRAWLIPSNVAIADPRHFFDRRDIITWTQSSRVQPGDTVYIYAGMPIGAIMYQCLAVETDLPADKVLKENFSSSRMMRLRLVCRYPEDMFTRARLKDAYGISAVRGPRYATDRLDRDLRAAAKQIGAAE